MSPAILESALQMVDLGFAVLPLHTIVDGRCTCADPNCSQIAKHPCAQLVRHGLVDASTNKRQIRNWFDGRRCLNLGATTGRAIVIDVDPRHGGDESLAALERRHGRVPITWRALTGGGGEHIFFKPPEGVEIRNSANVVGAGIDVRGVGGYIVAVGSIHASGRPYVWSVDHHPDDVAIAQMPDWLVDLSLSRQRAVGAPTPVTAWRALACEGVKEGGRNDAVARLSGHLLRRNVDARVTAELLQAWNLARCAPPLSPTEVEAVVQSIASKELKRREAIYGAS